MRRPVATFTKISTPFGYKPYPYSVFKQHMGTDYAGDEGRPVFAPVSGTITKAYHSTAIGNTIELKEVGNGRLHRFMHLLSIGVRPGQRITEGQRIAATGGAKGAYHSGTASTGPHLHWDVRKGGTAYDHAVSDYYDPEQLLKSPKPAPKSAPAPAVPKVGSVIELAARTTRTTFKRGTTTVAGHIRTGSKPQRYIVRGYDAKYSGRVIINTASGGGNGVALALRYTNGTVIPGWKQV